MDDSSAQVLGEDGVPKRIDSFAMAIQMGCTVYDLEESELCYAPPFGSAKDPVNFAGMVAADILRGDMPQCHWSCILNGFLLDVRNPSELAVESVPGALNIPLPQLRARLDELPRDRLISVICRSGQRAYYATRILMQNGFKVQNISGGMLSRSRSVLYCFYCWSNRVTDEKLLLFKLHPCSRGLTDEQAQEIAEAAELIRCERGDLICRADEPVLYVYLVVHGRIRLELLDVNRKLVMQRFQTRGGHFGAMAASLAEPTPLNCTAEDPSVLLRIAYEKALEFSRKYEVFRANYLRMIADSIKQTLLNDKHPVRLTVTVFVHQSDETRLVSRKLTERLVGLGETPSLFSDRPTEIAGIQLVRIFGESGEMDTEKIRRRAGESLETGRAIFDVDANVDLQRMSQGFESGEQVFWCVTPGNWEASLARLQAVVARAPSWREKINIVWLLQPGERAPTASPLRDLAIRDFKVCFSHHDPHRGVIEFGGLERLVHFMRGIQIGLALGGGAARGMAHLGVLKKLEDSGISIDQIAGTSAGAMTGTLYASGLAPDYLVGQFTKDLTPSWLFRCLPGGDRWFLLYKYRRGQFDPMLRKYLDGLRLEQFPLPMHTITVDLISGSAVVRESGDAVHAITESINIPIISKPIFRNGQALVDGGLIDNVPADVLIRKGCNFVIAVSVTAKMELEFANNRSDTPAHKTRPASTIETLLRSYLVQNHSVNSLGVQAADFVIEPDVTQFELTAFTRTDEMAAVGEQTTLEVISEIRELLHRLDPELFPLPKD